MTRDFKRWWLADDDDVGTGRPHRPAAGKVTLTQNLPIQRRAGGGVRPAPKSIDLESFAFVQAYGGETKETSRASFPDDPPTSWLASGADQACRDAFDFDFKAIQRVEAAATNGGPEAVHAAAARGLEAPSQQLPHLARIQESFGKHDVAHVRAHVGGAAAEASEAMGAEAYATGDHVAFGRTPDLHTAAHEAAHVVQQRAGVQLKGGVGEAGDPYERHADAVADKVVAGESAEALLDEMHDTNGPPSSVGAIQHKTAGTHHKHRGAPSAVEIDEAFAFVLDALERGIQTRGLRSTR